MKIIKPCTRNNYMETIWEALSCFRENCIPEGIDDNDLQWDEVTTAMSFLEEDHKNMVVAAKKEIDGLVHNLELISENKGGEL